MEALKNIEKKVKIYNMTSAMFKTHKTWKKEKLQANMGLWVNICAFSITNF